MSPGDAGLAAAYAEAGRFTDAVATARQALALARSLNESDVAREIGTHLSSFEARRPVRDGSLSRLAITLQGGQTDRATLQGGD